MESHKPVEITSSEMDLGQLFSRIGGAISSTGSSIIRGIVHLRALTISHKWIFISMMAFSTVSGLVYFKNFKRTFYESSMILSSEYLNKRIMESSIKKLNLLVSEESKEGLKKALGISDSTARNIVSFEAKTFVEEKDVIELQVLKEQLKNSKLELENPKVIDEVINHLQVENQHAFEITVRLYNPQEFRSLEKGFVSFFRTNNYINKRIESNNKRLQGLRSKLMSQQRQLDSLKLMIYENYRSQAASGKTGSNNVILDQTSTPTDIYRLDLSLYKDLAQADVDLSLQADFEVVEGFTEMSVPAGPSTIKIALLSLLIGIGLTYILLGLIKFNVYLSNYKLD